jgi:hypothetical protein
MSVWDILYGRRSSPPDLAELDDRLARETRIAVALFLDLEGIL